MYAACGTQADVAGKNKLTVIKLTNMTKTYRRGGQESDSEEEEDEDEEEEGMEGDPLLEQCSIEHRGGCVRKGAGGGREGGREGRRAGLGSGNRLPPRNSSFTPCRPLPLPV